MKNLMNDENFDEKWKICIFSETNWRKKPLLQLTLPIAFYKRFENDREQFTSALVRYLVAFCHCCFPVIIFATQLIGY